MCDKEGFFEDFEEEELGDAPIVTDEDVVEFLNKVGVEARIFYCN
jgi:hypothetical protein